jgi:hypothetical protein
MPILKKSDLNWKIQSRMIYLVTNSMPRTREYLRLISRKDYELGMILNLREYIRFISRKDYEMGVLFKQNMCSQYHNTQRLKPNKKLKCFTVYRHTLPKSKVSLTI